MTASSTVIVLALVFLFLGWVVGHSGRVSPAEAWILFLAGLLFWASGLGVVAWTLVNGLFHMAGGR